MIVGAFPTGTRLANGAAMRYDYLRSKLDDYEKLVVGVNAIYKQFGEVVVGEGVLVIPGTPGTPFDPNLHNAVLRDEESGHPENTIVEELQRGYMLGSKVLRPTLVKVATGG